MASCRWPWPAGALGAEEPLESGRDGALGTPCPEPWPWSWSFGRCFVPGGARSYRDVDDRGSHAGCDGFDRVVERDQRGDAVVIERSCGALLAACAVLWPSRKVRPRRTVAAAPAGTANLLAVATNELVDADIVYLILGLKLMFKVEARASRRGRAMGRAGWRWNEQESL